MSFTLVGRCCLLRQLYVVLVLALFPQLLAAASLDEGLKAYRDADYTQALSVFETLAKQGDPDAAFYLGVMYNEGTGTPINNKAAREWLRFSATSGNILAPVEYSVSLKLGQRGGAR